MEMQHESLWNEAVAFTRAKSPASFEQWFSGVQFDGMTDGIVSLRARDEFVREWVDQHFLPTLIDYLRSQTGWSVQIAWSIGGELQRPVADALTGTRMRTTSTTPLGTPIVRATDDVAPALDADAAPASRRSATTRAAAPPLEGLNPKYTFANFVVGPSNQLAHAAAIGA